MLALHVRNALLVSAASFFVGSPAVSGVTAAGPELDCRPVDAGPPPSINDPFFASEVQNWSKTTRSRYIEGDRHCDPVQVLAYEGFPTKRCSYANADAGKGLYPPLAAEVVVLDPSAAQLAAWSVHACRSNGATDTTMAGCLAALKDHVVKSNSAQFPVAGSAVELVQLRSGCCSMRPAGG